MKRREASAKGTSANIAPGGKKLTGLDPEAFFPAPLRKCAAWDGLLTVEGCNEKREQSAIGDQASIQERLAPVSRPEREDSPPFADKSALTKRMAVPEDEAMSEVAKVIRLRMSARSSTASGSEASLHVEKGRSVLVYPLRSAHCLETLIA